MFGICDKINSYKYIGFVFLTFAIAKVIYTYANDNVHDRAFERMRYEAIESASDKFSHGGFSTGLAPSGQQLTLSHKILQRETINKNTIGDNLYIYFGNGTDTVVVKYGNSVAVQLPQLQFTHPAWQQALESMVKSKKSLLQSNEAFKIYASDKKLTLSISNKMSCLELESVRGVVTIDGQDIIVINRSKNIKYLKQESNHTKAIEMPTKLGSIESNKEYYYTIVNDALRYEGASETW